MSFGSMPSYSGYMRRGEGVSSTHRAAMAVPASTFLRVLAADLGGSPSDAAKRVVTRLPDPSPLPGPTEDHHEVVDQTATLIAALQSVRTQMGLLGVALVSSERPDEVTFTKPASSGCIQLDELASELPALSAPHVDLVLDVPGPGESWHVHLTPDQADALQTLHQTITCSQITVPLRDDDECSLTVMWGGQVAPNKPDLDLAHATLSQIAEFLRQANHAPAEQPAPGRDELTGLPNRFDFAEAVAALSLAQVDASVFIVNLDRFSAVNDALGFRGGDQILRLFADRLRSSLDPTWTLARVAGDAFGLVIPGGSYQRSCDVAEQLLRITDQPFVSDHDPIMLGLSVGVCIAEAATGHGPREVLAGASKALQEAKANGRNRYAHRTPSSTNGRARNLESDLRRAVRDNELLVHYQPEFDLRTGQIVGAEALVRWMHPTRGMVSPTEFVPLCEDLGLSHDLASFVLDDALATTKAWRSEVDPNFTMRVNLSPRDLERSHVTDGLIQQLENSGLATNALAIEVTETALMRDQEAVLNELQKLADAGIALSIDDFGTGYSSLWMLRDMPFDNLKIDRRFVTALEAHDPADVAILAMIVQLSRTLGMTTTAEGIETVHQLDTVRSLGVENGQGFLLARPEPAAVVDFASHEPFWYSSAPEVLSAT